MCQSVISRNSSRAGINFMILYSMPLNSVPRCFIVVRSGSLWLCCIRSNIMNSFEPLKIENYEASFIRLTRLQIFPELPQNTSSDYTLHAVASWRSVFLVHSRKCNNALFTSSQSVPLSFPCFSITKALNFRSVSAGNSMFMLIKY